MSRRKFKPGDRVCIKPADDPRDIARWRYGTFVQKSGAHNLSWVYMDHEKHPKCFYNVEIYPAFA